MNSMEMVSRLLAVATGLALSVVACSTPPVMNVQTPAHGDSDLEAAGSTSPGVAGEVPTLPAKAPPSAETDAGVEIPGLTESDDVGPSRPELPNGVEALEVQGFSPSAYVAPDGSSPPPWPLIVVLHGNFDRPEWECQTWAEQGRSRGWLLCPRGYPRDDVPEELDRWTYHGRARLAKEVGAGVSALEALYPDLVRRDDAVLVGFSLGANMAPRFITTKTLGFRYVVLGEGGYQVTAEVARSAARHGVSKVAYLCGEKTACAMRTKQLNRFWKRAGVEASTLIMPGVGHGYPSDVDDITRRTFAALGL